MALPTASTSRRRFRPAHTWTQALTPNSFPSRTSCDRVLGKLRALEVNEMPDDCYVNSPIVTSFITHVLEMVAAEPSLKIRVERMRTAFRNLLAADGWLPPEFTRPNPTS